MRLKKQIKAHFDSIPLPTADKLLPKSALLGNAPKKASGRLFVKLAAVAVCLCAITASLIVLLNNPHEPYLNTSVLESVSKTLSKGASNTNESKSSHACKPDENTSEGSNISVKPITSDNPNVSNTDTNNPSNVLKVYTTQYTGEFAADMYRPEGYHDNIGSVLALMMHYTPEDDAKFNVLIYTFKDKNIEDIISQVNKMISEEISLDQLKAVEVENDVIGNIKQYYFSLNKEQINALSDNNVYCMYIGSGIGKYEDQNWYTVEGIKTFCEIHGDMYTFNNHDIVANPDIYIED